MLRGGFRSSSRRTGVSMQIAYHTITCKHKRFICLHSQVVAWYDTYMEIVPVRRPFVFSRTETLVKKVAQSKQYKGDNPCFACNSNRHAGCRPRLDGTDCSCQC